VDAALLRRGDPLALPLQDQRRLDSANAPMTDSSRVAIGESSPVKVGFSMACFSQSSPACSHSWSLSEDLFGVGGGPFSARHGVLSHSPTFQPPQCGDLPGTQRVGSPNTRASAAVRLLTPSRA
jgi:hypothetical protein